MAIIDKIKNGVQRHLPPAVIERLKQGVYCFYGLRGGHLGRLKVRMRDKPLILAVETVSICNARCAFCAYPLMSRAKEVMPLAVFEKIVREYSELGGGALSLTPVMGDPLIDPHLMERYHILDRFPNIDQISFTTNGIAFTRFSDEDILQIIQKTFLIQISIGGLDRALYRELYGVDKLDEVMESARRLMRLKKSSGATCAVILAFRTNQPKFEEDFAKEIREFKAQGFLVSHLCSFNSYAGEVTTRKVQIRTQRRLPQKAVCALPLVHAHVYSNGKITNCGCVDANANGLIIGDGGPESLGAVWTGQRRSRFLGSFAEGKVPPLCRGCTAYRPEKFLGAAAFQKIKSEGKLPVEFYLKFFGG